MKSAIIFTIFTALAAAQVTRDNDGYETTTTTGYKPGKPSSTTTTSVSALQYPAYTGASEEAAPTTSDAAWVSSVASSVDAWASGQTTVNSGWPESSGYAAPTSAAYHSSEGHSYAQTTLTSSSAKGYTTSKASSTSASPSAFTGAAVQAKDAVFGFGLAVAGAGLAMVL